MTNARLLTAITGAILCAALGLPAFAAAPSDNCDTATVQDMAPSDTTVAFAARQGGICRVVGYVTTKDPGPNKVLFTLGLPNAFNGRYVYLGVGGATMHLIDYTIYKDWLAISFALASFM